MNAIFQSFTAPFRLGDCSLPSAAIGTSEEIPRADKIAIAAMIAANAAEHLSRAVAPVFDVARGWTATSLTR
jgi:hypothetical protein